MAYCGKSKLNVTLGNSVKTVRCVVFVSACFLHDILTNGIIAPPPFVLCEKLEMILKKNRTRYRGNELLKFVYSADMTFALLGKHVRPYIEVQEFKVQVG